MTAHWFNGRLCAFDTETTGVDTTTDRIVTAHIGLVGGGEATMSRSWLVNPGVPIPPEATAIHSVTDEQASHGQDAATAVDLIAGEVCLAMGRDVPVVGWNVVFDLSILAAEIARHGLPSLEDRLGRPVGPVVDGLVLDKAVDKYRKGSRKLVDVAVHYDVALLEADAHGAAADAMAAARVVYKIAARFPEVGDVDLGTLQARQQVWAAEQAASLEAYLRRKDPTVVVERGWPVRGVEVPA